MTETVNIWIAGRYEAMVRPGPGKREVRNFVWEEFPVSIKAIRSEDAPIAIRWIPKQRNVGRPEILRCHEGAYYRPFRQHSETTMDDYAAAARKGQMSTVFHSSGNVGAETISEIEAKPGMKVLNLLRDGFEDRLTEMARKVLSIDGFAYEMTVEPTLKVRYDGTPERVYVSVEDQNPLDSTHSIDELDEAIRFAAHLAEIMGCDVVDETGDLEVTDAATVTFDGRDCCYRTLARSGASVFGSRNLSQFSDDTLQTALNLRRIDHARGVYPLEKAAVEILLDAATYLAAIEPTESEGNYIRALRRNSHMVLARESFALTEDETLDGFRF